MKIATFNINNINKRLANLLAWLRSAKPDVVCLQELKATDREFPHVALANAGYGAVWRGQRSWNGVGAMAKVPAASAVSFVMCASSVCKLCWDFRTVARPS